MRLGQVKVEGRLIAAVWEGDLARPIPSHTTLDLIKRAETENRPLSAVAAELASRHAEKLAPLCPCSLPKSGPADALTKPAPAFATPSTARAKACTHYVYREPRPEIFFKGTARVCVPSGSAHRHSCRFAFHRARTGAGRGLGQPRQHRGLHFGERRVRPGTSNARIPSICRNPRSMTVAAPSARSSLPPMRCPIHTRSKSLAPIERGGQIIFDRRPFPLPSCTGGSMRWSRRSLSPTACPWAPCC